jgi:hypothetical protein
LANQTELRTSPPAKRARVETDSGAGPVRRRSCRPVLTSPAIELLRDSTTGISVLSKICNSSWWDWSRGSTLAFWRWPKGEQRRASRDGMDPYIQSEPPAFKLRLKRPKQEAFDLLLPKIQAISARGYVVSNQDSVGSMCHTIERTDRQGYPNC